MFEESKNKIVGLLLPLIKETRAGRDIESLVLSDNEETVIIRYTDGREHNVCVAADSGTGIVKDVLRRIE